MVHNEDVDIWRRVNLLFSRVGDLVGTALRRQHGLSVTEFLTLLNLSEAEGGALRIQAIADAVGLDQSSVSRLIARLSQQGWLERCVCPEDKRGIYAQITEAGRLKADNALPTFSSELSTVLDDAGTDRVMAVVVGRLRQRRS